MDSEMYERLQKLGRPLPSTEEAKRNTLAEILKLMEDIRNGDNEIQQLVIHYGKLIHAFALLSATYVAGREMTVNTLLGIRDNKILERVFKMMVLDILQLMTFAFSAGIETERRVAHQLSPITNEELAELFRMKN